MIFIDRQNPNNSALINFMETNGSRGFPEVLPPDVKDRRYLAYNKEPYPVWRFLQSSLPTDCRCLIYGRVALVSPQGSILAVVLGDCYILRLPPAVAASVLQSPKMQQYLELRKKTGDSAPHERFGDHWAYGLGQEEEPSWCRSVYDADQPQRRGMNGTGR